MSVDVVKLRIKSPSLSLPDVNIEASVTSTVLEIKQRIEVEYASHPSPQQQKLVYSGKLLDDSTTLQSILRFEDDCSVFTFHLVCKVAPESVNSQPKTSPKTESPATVTPSDGLRRRNAGNNNNNNATVLPPTNPQPIPSVNNIPEMTASNAAGGLDATYAQAVMHFQALNRMFHELNQRQNNGSDAANSSELEAMYSEYVDLYRRYVDSLGRTEDGMAGAGLAAPPVVEQNQPQPVVGGGFPADLGQAANNPPGMEARLQPEGLGMAAIEDNNDGDEPEPEQADFLARVYALTRLLIIFSVVYFHSSFMRLGLVILFGYLVYFLQNRNRRLNSAQRPAGINNRQNQQAAGIDNNDRRVGGAPEQNRDQPADNDHVEPVNAGEEAAMDENGAVINRNENVKPSFLRVAFTFATTFFTSMLPGDPTVIQQ